jgi:TetR/AcrR family transcriptional repressor of nem operon
VQLFRERGYAGTSAELLVQRLGVSRYAIYSEFGSKQGLFDEALRRYDEDLITRRFGPLEAPGAGLGEIRALLGFFGSAGDGPAAGLGCLLCNTAVELGPLEPSAGEVVQRYFERVSRAFRHALGNARERGQLRATVDLEAEASFFTATLLGLFVLIRARAPATMIEEAARVALGHLESLGA